MKLIATFFRWLIGPSLVTLVEDLHVRLLNDWILVPAPSFVHAHCTWKLTDGHSCAGIHKGPDFYKYYLRQVERTYPEWYEVIKEVIGTRIGGIVIGEYQFQRELNGQWYTAPFTHFYRIQQGQIVSAFYYMGEKSTNLNRLRPTTNLPAYFAVQSLN